MSLRIVEIIKMRLNVSSLLQRVAGGAFWSFLAALGNNLGNLLVGVILIHILGKYAYGQYGMLRSTINMFILFSSFSIGATATKYIAEFRDTDRAKTGRIIGLSLLSVSILSVVFFLGCYIGADYLAIHSLNSLEMSPYIKIGAWMILFATMNGVCIGILSGFESFSLIAVINMIGAFVLVIGSWIGAWCWELKGALIALSVYLGSMMIISLFLFVTDLKKYQIVINFSDCSKELAMLWKFSLPTSLGGLLIAPVLWLGNTILIKSPAGYDAMAVCDILNQWKMAALFFPNIIGRIALPMLSNLNSKNNGDDYFKAVKINFLLNVGTAFGVALVLSIGSKWILGMYGSSFTANIIPFMLMMLATVFSAANSIIGQIILSKGQAWFGCFFNMLWAAVFLVSVYYFVCCLNYGVLGITLSFLISYVCHTVWQYVFLYFTIEKINGNYL